MKLAFGNNKDFWAGLMFAGIGAGAILVAQGYPFGTTLRMGPGYFPRVLGVILLVFGLYVMLRGLRRGEQIKGHWSIRALTILPLSMVLFGVTMEAAGFIPALFVLIFVAAASGREFKFKEVLLLTLFLSFLSVAMFIWGLGLPYPLLKGF
ncbi:MAG: tripartite tricarboxylate transporter TctB family protein [Syntrophales bacterium]